MFLKRENNTIYFRNGITIFESVFYFFSGVSKVINLENYWVGLFYKERNPKHNLLKCITFLDLKLTNS